MTEERPHDHEHYHDDHARGSGVVASLRSVFAPHSHDHSESIDSAVLADSIHNVGDALTAVPLRHRVLARPAVPDEALHLRLRKSGGPRGSGHRPHHRGVLSSPCDHDGTDHHATSAHHFSPE